MCTIFGQFCSDIIFFSPSLANFSQAQPQHSEHTPGILIHVTISSACSTLLLKMKAAKLCQLHTEYS